VLLPPPYCSCTAYISIGIRTNSLPTVFEKPGGSSCGLLLLPLLIDSKSTRQLRSDISALTLQLGKHLYSR
jgi:hypothetical protein